MKTVEEAAKEYVKGLNLKGHDSFDFETYAKQDFKAGVEFAQRWISVEDEMPESPSTVLFSNKTHTLISTGLFEKGSFYPDWNTLEQKNITHWRPIELK